MRSPLQTLVVITSASALACASVAILPFTPLAPASAIASAACVAEAGPGMPPPGNVRSGIEGFHAVWYGQSGYPTLCPGERASAVVAFYNSGTRGWVAGRAGETALIGTADPVPGENRPSLLGGDGTFGSPNTGWPAYNRPALQPAPYVGPGQVAWFRFTIQAPQTPGTYRLSLRPLIEGTTWMEDFGIFWQVTVREDPASLAIAPATAIALIRGSTRVYTLDVSPSLAGGCIDLALIDVRTAPTDGTFRDESDASGRPMRDGKADFTRAAAFNTVGTSGGSASFAQCIVLPSSGHLQFTITSVANDAFVRPIAFHDQDGDGALELDATGHPLEPVSVGGATHFIEPLPGGFDPEA